MRNQETSMMFRAFSVVEKKKNRKQNIEVGNTEQKNIYRKRKLKEENRIKKIFPVL